MQNKLLHILCQKIHLVIKVEMLYVTRTQMTDIKMYIPLLPVKCWSCNFTFVGETKNLWNSHGSKHKPGFWHNNRESAIKDHAETTDHDICIMSRYWKRMSTIGTKEFF